MTHNTLRHRNKPIEDKNWHLVYTGKDQDGRPLINTREPRPNVPHNHRPLKFPRNTIFVAMPAEFQSEFMIRLNSRFIFLHQKPVNQIKLSAFGRVCVAIEPRNRFYVVDENELPYYADLWSFDEHKAIDEVLMHLYYRYFQYAPIQIRIDTYSQLTPSWFDIFWNRITFFHGKREYNSFISLDTLEFLANMYDSMIMSEDQRLVMKSYSKHTLYLDGDAIGALLLEDVMMIQFIYKALKKERDCMDMHIIPDFEELYENIDKYVAKWVNFIPKKLHDLLINFDNQFIKSEFAQLQDKKHNHKHEHEHHEQLVPAIPDEVVYVDEEGNIVDPVEL